MQNSCKLKDYPHWGGKTFTQLKKCKSESAGGEGKALLSGQAPSQAPQH